MKHNKQKELADGTNIIIKRNLDDIKQRLEMLKLEYLLRDSATSNKNVYYTSRIADLRAFEHKANRLVKKAKKEFKKEMVEAMGNIGLTDKQANEIADSIKMGDIAAQASQSYLKDVAKIKTSRIEVGNIFEEIQQMYQNKVNAFFGTMVNDTQTMEQWQVATERAIRTEIHTQIKEGMVETGYMTENVFYLVSYFGDCADDHVCVNGAILYDKRFESFNIPEDVKQQIRDYIESNKLYEVNEVTDPNGEIRLTTRWNCRHFLQYIGIEQVLGCKTEKDKAKLREDNQINFNGKYEPKKYEYLQEQRYNERGIRKWKDEKEVNEALLKQAVKNGESLEKISSIDSRIHYCNQKVAKWQEAQRDLVAQNVKEFGSDSNIVRDYRRESTNIRYDLGAKK